MRDCDQFYIDGAWVSPLGTERFEVTDPTTEASGGHVALGSAADVDRAVAAARRGFEGFSRLDRADRLELLRAVAAEYSRRQDDMAEAISAELGAPGWLARDAQAAAGAAHLGAGIAALETFPFEEERRTTRLVREPIGVCALITPWNWPSNQIACKVVPAIATGCSMVLKPSELSPFSAHLWAEILDRAGLPAGVFNLVHGDGAIVGAALASHSDVDMVSFTGSTAAGIAVAEAAAPSVKRVHQELGGKSANIILDDADLASAVEGGVRALMVNSGQSCNAPTRMLVPSEQYEAAVDVARATAAAISVGPPSSDAMMGPVISARQWQRIQDYIGIGVAEGARLAAGGEGRPDGFERGFYVRPTIFADVHNGMRVAREEIFGPVLTLIPYDTEEEAIAIANDSPFGLAAYVQGRDTDRVLRVARRLRAGQVGLNYAPVDFDAPFGGYKQSGNGREWGEEAFREFLETKAIIGLDEQSEAPARPLS